MDPLKNTVTEVIPLEFEHNGKIYKGEALPLHSDCSDSGECVEMDITLNDEHIGTLYCGKDQHCTIRNLADSELVSKIADQVMLWK